MSAMEPRIAPLDQSDRTALIQIATAMLRATAAGDHTAAVKMGNAVAARWGAPGISYALELWTLEAVECAGPEVRNPFGKIRPDLAIGEDEYRETVQRIREDYVGSAARGLPVDVEQTAPDRLALLDTLGQYLAAFQRGDTPAVRTALLGLPNTGTLPFDVLRALVLLMASRYSPVRQTPGTGS